MCLYSGERRGIVGRRPRLVDFSYTPEPHVAFCPIFVDPFLSYTP